MRRHLLALVIICSFPGAQAQECPVIPLPASMRLDSGDFLLDRQTVIVPADSSLYELAWKLQKMVFEETGYALTVGPRPDENPARKAVILLKRVAVVPEYNGAWRAEEAYRLSVTAGKIVIEAGDDAGVFYGMISLLQLAQHSVQQLSSGRDSAIPLPCWQIEDGPFYSWRGLMLDEARHFFGKEKEVLDQMAYYKLNRFHWHLTDVQGWRIEIREYAWPCRSGQQGLPRV